jgi:hypothetical protein
MILVPDACDCFDLPCPYGGDWISAEQVQAAHVATLAYEFCRIMKTAELAGVRA